MAFIDSLLSVETTTGNCGVETSETIQLGSKSLKPASNRKLRSYDESLDALTNAPERLINTLPDLARDSARQ
jgi:hypothetical protein